MDAIKKEAAGLYGQSSKLRALARMLRGNEDHETEKNDVIFSADELSGMGFMLLSIADEIDFARDKISDAVDYIKVE